MLKKPVVCLMGPTAAGKTALALSLCEQYPFDIISVDSAMVYRGMDIGTATPDAKTLKAHPHRLINLCDPSQSYSAGQFCEDARHEIKLIHAQGRIPLLVGGTMLYFNLLQRGFMDFPKADLEIRQELERKADLIGWEALHCELKVCDPASAARIHPNDKQRIARALALFQATGQTLTQWQADQQWDLPNYAWTNLILMPSDRDALKARIADRFDEMLSLGLIEEVQTLFSRDDLHAELPAIRMVGYRQVWSHLLKEIDDTQMRSLAIIATRQLAKRQITWLRRWENALSFDSESDQLLDSVLLTLKKIS